MKARGLAAVLRLDTGLSWVYGLFRRVTPDSWEPVVRVGVVMLVLGFVAWSIHVTRTRPRPKPVIPAADVSNAALDIAYWKKRTADAEATIVAVESAAERQIAAYEAALAVSPAQTTCKPQVKWRTYCPKQPTLVEDLFGQ